MNERDSIRSLKDGLTICFMLYFGIFAILAIWLILTKNQGLIAFLVIVGLLMLISNMLYMSVEQYRDRLLFKWTTILLCIPIYPVVIILNWFIKSLSNVLKNSERGN